MDWFSDRGSIPLGSTMMHLSEHEATIVVLPTVFVLTVSLPAGV